MRDQETAFPPLQTVYDYCLDAQKKDWCLWDDKVPKGYRPAPGIPFYKILVPTVDTTRTSFLLQTLISSKKHVVLVGGTGVGKTAVVQVRVRARSSLLSGCSDLRNVQYR